MDTQLKTKQATIKNIYAAIIAVLAWISIGLQYYITDLSSVNFFSYYTTLCNLLIATGLTFSVGLPNRPIGRFFSDLSVQSAIATYIFIVSLVYNLILRGLWILTGLERILDNMVHVVVPILYIIYWILFRSKGTLKWLDGIYWAVFPFLYLVYSLIRGSILQWYPYPFLNTFKFGYEKVAINISLMLGVFIITGLILILITRFAKNKYL